MGIETKRGTARRQVAEVSSPPAALLWAVPQDIRLSS